MIVVDEHVIKYDGSNFRLEEHAGVSEVKALND